MFHRNPAPGDDRTFPRLRPVRIRRRGLAMIEVTLAIGVLVIAMGAFLRTQTGAAQLLATARDTALASADLQACMEEIHALPHEQVPIAGSRFAAGESVASFEGLHLQDERIVATYPDFVAGEPVPDPLEVVLTIDWNDAAGRPRQMRLASARTR